MTDPELGQETDKKGRKTNAFNTIFVFPFK